MALVICARLGVISEISECTINGAARRCSQNAQSERRVMRSRSDRSNVIAAAKTVSPQASVMKDRCGRCHWPVASVIRDMATSTRLAAIGNNAKGKRKRQ